MDTIFRLILFRNKNIVKSLVCKEYCQRDIIILFWSNLHRLYKLYLTVQHLDYKAMMILFYVTLQIIF